MELSKNILLGVDLVSQPFMGTLRWFQILEFLYAYDNLLVCSSLVDQRVLWPAVFMPLNTNLCMLDGVAMWKHT